MKKSSLKTAVAIAFPALMLSGCYVITVDQDTLSRLGMLPEAPKLPAAPMAAQTKAAAVPPQAMAPQPQAMAPQPPPMAAQPQGLKSVEPGVIAIPAGPVTLYARLYPANDIASEQGMVSGTVTSLQNGKGRFQISYRGETLTGEATRVSGDDRKGVASAWGPNGSFMSCEYQMSTLVRGAGMCHFSDGARYQVHVGN